MKRFATLMLLVCLVGCSQWAYKVPTEAMKPTIMPGDSVITDLIVYSKQPIERFDVVVLKAPPSEPDGGKEIKVVKRIIGLSGEVVEMRKGKVFINGRELSETFSFIPSNDDFGPMTVPDGEYFMLGDNRPNSFDSRFWNPATIKKKAIEGKVTEILHK
jgi:signal peptidase I